MTTADFLTCFVTEMHTTVIATVDDRGLPVTCAIDMMDSDENSLYFLTAKGKALYDRLKKREYVALTGLKGGNTMSCAAISIHGKVREIGGNRLARLFEKNPYMNEIYPTVSSRGILSVFQIYEGTGEWFDLSKKPIERLSFSFGNDVKVTQGYFITDKCIACKTCKTVCPQNCIDFTAAPAVIRQENCLHCGNCAAVCRQNAVVWKGVP